MATKRHAKASLLTWMLVFILMEQNKSVLAGRGFKKLQARVKAVEEHIAKEGDCQACSVIDQLLKRVEAVENRTPAPPPTTPPAPPTKPPLPSECQNYQPLSEANRKISQGVGHPVLCDDKLGPNWYRFQGDAGTKMADSCVASANRCGTHAPGWLSGGHPSVEEGKVTRLACFRYFGNCCQWSINIQVRNCGDFYVYYIDGTPRDHPCHLRYCGTD